LRTDFYSELGLRILLGFIARNALRHERGIRVLFSHSTMHYLRAYVQVDGRGGVVDDTMRSISFIQYCPKCLSRWYAGLKDMLCECRCGGKPHTAGPVWNGAFADKELCGNLKDILLEGKFNTKRDAVKLVESISLEQEVATPFYDLHKLCSRLGRPAPKTDYLRERLEESKLKFARTHFSDVGFRTDAGVEDINAIISNSQAP